MQLEDIGEGAPYLLLHGGAGPASFASFAGRLAEHGRVLLPTHPGFDGTSRPEELSTIRGLAELYARQLDGLDGVTVVGNSIGGWIAAELALLNPPQVSRVVLVDAVGIEVPGHPVIDFFSLSLEQVADYSFFDADKYRITSPPPHAAGNRETLAVYAGDMVDPTLRERLAGITLPTLVVWGDSDGIADPDYGRAYADAIPGAGFELLPRTGHLPQLESPDALYRLIARPSSAD